MDYTTQIDAARKDILTEELKRAAEKGLFEPAELVRLVAEGEAAIPASRLHTYLEPDGAGSRLETKINVNLGTSGDYENLEVELQKVSDTVRMGTESIMDLSSQRDTRTFRRKLATQYPAIIGTVPIYDAVVYYHKSLKDITSQEWLDIVGIHAKDGVDLITIHAGINRQTAEHFRKAKRLISIVSRGGSVIFAQMEITGKENPFYEHLEEILDICQTCDVTLSLGDARRPGCIKDASDMSQIEKLVTLGELTRRAWGKNIQVIIEGPGHISLDWTQSSMKIQQTICRGAPFYILGPLVTDIAPGYNHITAAISGTLAATDGASFLCYVTPTEHLRLPNLDDVKGGIMASKIAAHTTNIAKGIKGAAQWDREVSTARKNLDWERMFELFIDPERARKYRESAKPEREGTCSVCGNFCVVKNMNRILDGEIVSIFDE